MDHRLKLIHFGAELTCPVAWENYDCSPTFAFERIPIFGRLQRKNEKRFPSNLKWGNIVNGLGVSPASADAIYCSHVLEHLTLSELHLALLNTRAMLKPGGVFRMVLPDLEFYIKQYECSESHEAASDFMSHTLLGEERRWAGIYGFLSYLFGNARHRWMWDYKGLSWELGAAGFKEIRRATYGDCEIAALAGRFAEVEAAGRWSNALGIQCRI